MNAQSRRRPQPHPLCPQRQEREVEKLRLILTPAVVEDVMSCEQPDDLTRAIRTLQHLLPGQTERAMWCHRVLAVAARRDLRTLGCVDPQWTAALYPLVLYVEHAGWTFRDGRWVIAEPLEATAAPADRVIEPSAWELGLSAEAEARLRRSQRRRQRES